MWPSRAIKSLRNNYWKSREKEKVQQQLLIELKNRLRARGCSFATPRISWPPLKLKSLHLRRNWRRSRRRRHKQRGLGIRLSRIGMMPKW